jgi:hypothetical protein
MPNTNTHVEVANLHLGREFYPWFRTCTVRILIVADSSVRFSGGSFGGLREVLATLQSDPWFWVRFAVTTAHRSIDSSAAIQNFVFDAADLAAHYDEIWLFGALGFPNTLSAVELTAIHAFMDNGGGVLVTGDHEDLGAGLASGIKRAGKMRRWNPSDPDPTKRAPSATGFDRNDTLRAGADATVEFDDQSDQFPQTLRLRWYPLFNFYALTRRARPHQVMCGRTGPIRLFPDHMHEGQIYVPPVLDPAEWPTTGGYRPGPEIIAWGRDLGTGSDGSATDSEEFGVVGAYNGHDASVGRIVADSTWHHWLDINLRGEPFNTDPLDPKSMGFHWPAADPAVLSGIQDYFRNVAVWLAPPALQSCMRNALWWGAIWLDPLVMIRPKADLLLLGEVAIDALGKYAPQCAVRYWIWDMIAVPIKLALAKRLMRLEQHIPHLEELALGHILSELKNRYPTDELPSEPIGERELDDIFEGAFSAAIERSQFVATEQVKSLRSLLRQIQAEEQTASAD